MSREPQTVILAREKNVRQKAEMLANYISNEGNYMVLLDFLMEPEDVVIGLMRTVSGDDMLKCIRHLAVLTLVEMMLAIDASEQPDPEAN